MNTVLPSSLALPVPVILAAHPLKAFWPRSTPERPWCFRRSGGPHSPVEILLAQFCKDPRFAPPLLVVSESAIRAAGEQTAVWRQHGVKVITVPVDTRNGTAATLAALELAASNLNRQLVFVPATLAATSERTVTDILARTCTMLGSTRKAIIHTRRATIHDRGIAYEHGHSIANSGNHLAAKIHNLDDSDASHAALSAGSLHVPAGPFICPASLFLDSVRRTVPMLLKSAASALELAERLGHVIHPHSGFLSLVGGHSMSEFIRPEDGLVVLSPVAEALKTLSGWADLSPDGDTGASPLSVAAAGIGAHRIIQGPAGIFVCTKGHEHEAANWYPSPGETDLYHQPGSTSREWGSEQLISEEYGIRILRLEIEPGKVLPPECHLKRLESWSLCSGQAVVTIEGRIMAIHAGDHLTIPAGSIHSIRNTGRENLVLYESRIGSYLEEDDRIQTGNLGPIKDRVAGDPLPVHRHRTAEA